MTTTPPTVLRADWLFDGTSSAIIARPQVTIAHGRIVAVDAGPGSKGRLAPGSDADIVAVDGNPLADLGAHRNDRAVFHAGRPVQLEAVMASAAITTAAAR